MYYINDYFPPSMDLLVAIGVSGLDKRETVTPEGPSFSFPIIIT